MPRDQIYCNGWEDCPMAKVCQRADEPEANEASEAEYIDCPYSTFGEDYVCEWFLCNCSKVVWVGSNQYGNYYHCPVCGEEGEG